VTSTCDPRQQLVVGFMGHTRLYEQIIGSTTERLVRLAPCAALVVK
jgi:nucleotide-binding universal stress UspA family protein